MTDVRKVIMCIVLCLCLLPLSAQAQKPAAVIDVTPDSSLHLAVRKARELRRLGKAQTAVIRMSAGIYRLEKPLVIRPEDSHLTFQGSADGEVTISGAVELDGWQREGRYLTAQVPEFHGRPHEFRQMWINGRKAVRARDVEDFDKMNRICWVDKVKQGIWVPTNSVRRLIDKRGNILPTARYAEMVLHEMWEVANLRIKGITLDGDSALVTFHQPESEVQFSHPWPSPMYNSKHNSPYYITNAMPLLDTPGEWYHDIRVGKLYYVPFKGETEDNLTAQMPVMENLVKIVGTTDRRVNDVRFVNVSFMHTTWMRPSFEGHVPLQAGMYLTEAYKLRPQTERVNNHKLDNQGWIGRARAAVEVLYADNITFDKCTFSQTGGSGLDYIIGCKGGGVANSSFIDIAMNGVVTGCFSPEGQETHVPYIPQDTRDICEGQRIHNNIMSHIATEDWGCCAVTAGNVRNMDITNNTIDSCSYSAISIGWGWNRDSVLMRDNRIHANLITNYAGHMYDCAGIYTLGNQPGTVISENVIDKIQTPSYVHDPEHWFYLYTDEGSSNITLRDNWTPTEKYLKNACGPNNIWKNNGPAVSETIRKAAGAVKQP